jgi:hypothetical protein
MFETLIVKLLKNNPNPISTIGRIVRRSAVRNKADYIIRIFNIARQHNIL